MLLIAILLFWIPYFAFFLICCRFVKKWTKHRKILVFVLLLSTFIFAIAINAIISGTTSFFINLFFNSLFAMLMTIICLYHLTKK
jgi:hypothetical protein